MEQQEKDNDFAFHMTIFFGSASGEDESLYYYREVATQGIRHQDTIVGLMLEEFGVKGSTWRNDWHDSVAAIEGSLLFHFHLIIGYYDSEIRVNETGFMKVKNGLLGQKIIYLERKNLVEFFEMYRSEREKHDFYRNWLLPYKKSLAERESEKDFNSKITKLLSIKDGKANTFEGESYEPKVIKTIVGEQDLYIVSSLHTAVYESKSRSIIKKNFEDFLGSTYKGKQILLSEMVLKEKLINKDSDVKKDFSESGFIKYLANRDRVEIDNMMNLNSYEINGLKNLGKYKDQDIVLEHLLRKLLYWSYLQDSKIEDLQKIVEKIMENFKFSSSWGIQADYKSLSEASEELIGLSLNAFIEDRNRARDLIFGLPKDSFIKRLTDLAVSHRDEWLVITSVKKLLDGYNVFIEIDAINHVNPDLLNSAIVKGYSLREIK